MGYLWDIYGISKEQHRTGVKEMKKKRRNHHKEELKSGKILHEEML